MAFIATWRAATSALPARACSVGPATVATTVTNSRARHLAPPERTYSAFPDSRIGVRGALQAASNAGPPNLGSVSPPRRRDSGAGLDVNPRGDSDEEPV